MEDLIRSEYNNANVVSTDGLQFIKKANETGNDPGVGVFQIEGTPSINLQDDRPSTRDKLVYGGTAVFQQNRLTGFLDDEETKGLNLATGTVKSGGIYIPALQNPSRKISIEIRKNVSKIDPVLENGKPVFYIRVVLKGNITQVEDATDVSAQKNLSEINDEFKKMSQDEIRAAVSQAQALKTDALGFGRALEIKYPKYWNSVSEKWDQLFPDVPYVVQVNTALDQTGLLQKPMETQ